MGASAPTACRAMVAFAALMCLGIAGSSAARYTQTLHSYAGLDPAAEERGAPMPTHEKPAYAAWLTVENTPISLPVASLQDSMADDYYLTHDLWGNRSALGCLFMDRRCGDDGRHILVYGHRVNGTNDMFTPLSRVFKQQRFDELGDALWTVPGENPVRYRPLCALHVSARYADIQRFTFADDEELRTWLQGIAERADARNPDWRERVAEADSVLTLVTCSEANGHSATRTIVLYTANRDSALG